MNNVTQQDLEYIKDLLNKYDYTIIGDTIHINMVLNLIKNGIKFMKLLLINLVKD